MARLYADVNVRAPASHFDYESFSPSWQPPAQYSITHRLGRGKYSEVFAAVHEHSGRRVVLKVLKPVKKRKIKREIHVLRTLQGKQGVVRLLDCVRDPVTRYCSLVFEYVDAVDFKDAFPRMSDAEVRRVLWQLLRTLDYAHSQGIMHRDVKPHNVLVERESGAVHLIDWGLAEYYHPGREYNVRVASRYFKSPELLVGFQVYDYSLDMWSVGCVLAGLLFQTHPFFHGCDNVDQLVKIVRVLGTEQLHLYCSRYGIVLEEDMQHRLAGFHAKPWTRFVTNANRHLCTPDALDFLHRLLQMDHRQRLTTQEALHHPYLAALTKEHAEDVPDVEPPLPQPAPAVAGGNGRHGEREDDEVREQELSEGSTAARDSSGSGEADVEEFTAARVARPQSGQQSLRHEGA